MVTAFGQRKPVDAARPRRTWTDQSDRERTGVGDAAIAWYRSAVPTQLFNGVGPTDGTGCRM